MLTREFIECYRCYKIFKYTLPNGTTIYNGSSEYVHAGFITCTGDSVEEVIEGINNVYKRMQLIQLYKRIK